ncbi:DUF1419 domain-containing protein [Mesorhizobium sp. M1328]
MRLDLRNWFEILESEYRFMLALMPPLFQRTGDRHCSISASPPACAFSRYLRPAPTRCS